MSALHHPPAGLGEVVLIGCPRCHAMGVRGHEGGTQVVAESAEVKAEVVVRKMEAVRSARMEGAVRALEEVVLLGC